MKDNLVRNSLLTGRPTLSTRMLLNDPLVVEMIGSLGIFDYVEFLAEYSAYDLRSLEDFCRAAELRSLGTMIKIDWEQRAFVAQRSVGAGFDAVLFADPRSAADVQDCIHCLKPDTPDGNGRFGVGARRHTLPDYGGTPRYVRALEETVVAIMVEKKPAVDVLDEILEVSGIDFVQWGPSDYAMSIGRPGETASKPVRDAEHYVITTCLQAGIQPRAEIDTIDDAQYYLDLGVRHFSLGVDLFLLQSILGDGGERLRSTLADTA